MNHEELTIKSLMAAGKELLETRDAFSGKGSVAKECESNSLQVLESYLETTGFPVVSEFRKADLEEHRSGNNYWLISPLLGKKKLRERGTDFAVTISIIENNRPVMGGIIIPAKNVLYMATSEGKAYKINLSHLDRKVDVSDLLSEGNLISKPMRGFFVNVLKYKSKMNSRSEFFLQDFKAYYGGSLKEIVDESPLRLLGIVEGRYDLYPHLKKVKVWEIAAFDALITAAGYMVTKRDGIVPLQYSIEKRSFPGYIAKTNFELDTVDLS